MVRLQWQQILRAYVVGIGIPVLLGALAQWAMPGRFPFLFIGALAAIPLAVFLGVRAVWPTLQVTEEEAGRADGCVPGGCGDERPRAS